MATNRKTVMLVEDEPDLLISVKAVLQRNEYLVHDFSNPQSALEHIKGEGCTDCKLVVCDIKMPQMTGVELAVHLKRIRPDLKILLMTAMPVDREQWRKVLPGSRNVDGFIPKPFTSAELLQAVNKLSSSTNT